MKRTIASILLAVLTIAALALPAQAHTVPETGRTGSITVNMRYDGKPLSGGELTLYPVGEVAEDDGNYSFAKTGRFTRWDGEFGDLENSAEIAESLAEFVKDNGIIGTHEPVKDGRAKFDNDGEGLPQGLYLIIQTAPADGYYAVAPFLVSLPYHDGAEYQYDVRAEVKTELEKTTETTPPTKPPEKPGKPGKLPQTGQLWWPVPVLVCAGLACIAVGLIRRRRGQDEV